MLATPEAFGHMKLNAQYSCDNKNAEQKTEPNTNSGKALVPRLRGRIEYKRPPPRACNNTVTQGAKAQGRGCYVSNIEQAPVLAPQSATLQLVDLPRITRARERGTALYNIKLRSVFAPSIRKSRPLPPHYPRPLLHYHQVVNVR